MATEQDIIDAIPASMIRTLDMQEYSEGDNRLRRALLKEQRETLEWLEHRAQMGTESGNAFVRFRPAV